MLYRKLFMTNFNITFLAEKKRATKTNENNSQGMILILHNCLYKRCVNQKQ